MPQKILIVRFSSIGDIVLTTPVVRCLQQQLGGAEIHYLTKEAFAPILRANPRISKVITIRKKVSEVVSQLRAERYDHIIDLHNNLRSWQVIAMLGVPFSRFTKLNIRKWLLVRFKLNLMPDVHIVDRYMNTVKHLGVKNDGEGLEFYIPPEDEVSTGSLPGPFRAGYVAFVTGGRHNTKILPSEKIIEVCRKLRLPVILLGGPEDFERAQEVAAVSELNAMNACGKYSLMQSASLVKQARVVITNDTGLMHIAAAFHKPIVSVWGNTVPDFGMYPYLKPGEPQFVAEVKGLNCRPCSKIGFDECPKGHFKCMLDQNTGDIADFANRFALGEENS